MKKGGRQLRLGLIRVRVGSSYSYQSLTLPSFDVLEIRRLPRASSAENEEQLHSGKQALQNGPGRSRPEPYCNPSTASYRFDAQYEQQKTPQARHVFCASGAQSHFAHIKQPHSQHLSTLRGSVTSAVFLGRSPV